MEAESIKFSAMSRLKKPERKVIEKNRRNHMKSLYSQLFSLVPPHFISKGDDQVLNRVDRTIDYIQTLKTNLEMKNNKKENLLSKKRAHQNTLINNNECKSIDHIQIYEMGHDLDVVLVTGLKDHSSFCKVVQFLDQYSVEVTLANFSSGGHSTFHIRQKKIEGEDICKRLKSLFGGYSEMKELGDNVNHASVSNEYDSDLNVWDFDLPTNAWGLWDQLELLPMNIIS